jgi:hypothetical protein
MLYCKWFRKIDSHLDTLHKNYLTIINIATPLKSTNLNEDVCGISISYITYIYTKDSEFKLTIQFESSRIFCCKQE